MYDNTVANDFSTVTSVDPAVAQNAGPAKRFGNLLGASRLGE